MYDNRSKITIFIIVLSLILSLFTLFISSESTPSVSAKAAALYQPNTNNFLYLKNADEKLPMASTTKIMTALISLERLDLSENVAIDARAVGIEGSSIYLKAGEVLNALDLIYAVMLQSANDAAAALAYKISGSIEAFAELMNEKAKELELKNTNFTNPHGLDNKEHYTTARELAIITAEAYKNNDFKTIASTYKKEIESSEVKRTLVNHNKLLKSYEGCIGVKTGYTKKSGRCLVSAAERDNLPFICVTINAPDDWRDHTEMLDYGYSLLEAKTLAYSGQFNFNLPVICGNEDTVSISNTNEIVKIFKKNDMKVESTVKLPRYVVAPVNRGDVLGKIIFTKCGEKIAELNLIATKDINEAKNKKKFSLF
jgi:D-alanyl-D-alanine carboxypeptidase/D-alanyl-D-alanine carboxypeptidase (penicillin-binding protein 5/6)